MSESFFLEAEKRQIVGKQVKQLRRAGQIPAVVYGPESEPINLTLDHRALRQVLLQAGGTQLIELRIGKEKIPTLARVVQRDPVGGDILHVDFYRVSMTRPIAADIPLLLVGENALAESGEGMVVHSLNSVQVEALPAELPQHIEVDISVLKEIGEQLLVKDLPVPPGATILTDGDELVARLDYLQRIEEEEEAAAVDLFEEESAEPEVITRRRDEDEEE